MAHRSAQTASNGSVSHNSAATFATQTSDMPDEPNPSPRQTLSYIKGLLQSRRLIPKNKMGQNFLIDLNLLDVVVRTAELTKEDCVLEVGTGTGGLTSRLADVAGGVFTVELDPKFFEMSRHLLAARPNVRQLHGDALAGKNQLNPHLVSGWNAIDDELRLTRRKVVANLPYAIATPLIANLIIAGIPIERMVVMVQWEVAERMTAASGTKDFGALAVLLQSVTDVEIVRRIAPTNFWPRPEVDSAIVLIQPNAAKARRVPALMKWRAFLRDLYTHRRKNLRQALSGWPTGRKDKTVVDAELARLGIDGSVRAETLDVEQHLRLYAAFQGDAP
jgi:16S rRNA (adenine1518-N6/adenine1519-N6)-dimethyltransferase